ncbi:MAG: arginase [Paracoccaceae bacterium]
MGVARLCSLVGAPVECGAAQRGCIMGPTALRTAGIAEALSALGHKVRDLGDVRIPPAAPRNHANAAIHSLGETIELAKQLSDTAQDAFANDAVPVFMGGDHSISLGSVAAAARHSRSTGREQFVLWLDAHPDFHTLETTETGNLHGTPVAYFTGRRGFEGFFPTVDAPVKPENICMLGIRSVDDAERDGLVSHRVAVHDMRALDEHGVARPLRAFLHRVAEAGGALHVSLDVDFLEPEIAPAVGTTVPGGATFREAHLVMEMLHDSGLVTSLDLVELNPFLDDRGRTAKLLVDLVSSLFGKRVMDRPTRSY